MTPAEEKSTHDDPIKQQSSLPKVEVVWGDLNPRGQVRFFIGKLPGNNSGRAIVITATGLSPIELELELVGENGFLQKIEDCGFYAVDCKIIKIQDDVPEKFSIKVVRLVEK